MSRETVTVELDDGIAWVTLNRPEKRNAMNPTLNVEMVDVLLELDADDDCGVLVLTGAGDSFSAGMDLKEYFREVDGQPEHVQRRVRRDANYWQWRLLRTLPEADDRDGQRLVLRRRLHAALRLRSRRRSGRGDLRPLRDQLGHPARGASSAAASRRRSALARRSSTS